MGAKEQILDLVNQYKRETDVAREVWTKEVDYLYALHTETGNPLYAWQVMALHCRYRGKFPLPEWCADYFSNVSHKLFALSRMQDIRSQTFSLGSLNVTQLPSSAKALDLVPLALGLSGQQGKSVLADFNSRLTKGYEVSLFENLRANGVSRREAIETLLRITNREDERSLRRAFAESEIRTAQRKLTKKARKLKISKKSQTSPRGSARGRT